MINLREMYKSAIELANEVNESLRNYFTPRTPAYGVAGEVSSQYTPSIYMASRGSCGGGVINQAEFEKKGKKKKKKKKQKKQSKGK